MTTPTTTPANIVLEIGPWFDGAGREHHDHLVGTRVLSVAGIGETVAVETDRGPMTVRRARLRIGAEVA